MRGKGSKWCVGRNQQRITPAYAGKSFATISSDAPFRDHPRLCGEKGYQINTGNYDTGSPPPMRGKEPFSSSTSVISGITPAYAGKSSFFVRLLDFR